MRRRAEQIGDVGVDAFASEALGAAKAKRLEQLLDDGTTPLFFGRLDYADPPEQFHIGRRHVLDDRGDPMVVDWRAPISLPFYRATPREPLGVALRRRFGFEHGLLTGFEDEVLAAGEYLGTDSRILVEEIERPRVGPMRDIVATIQPDQDEIVRADLAETICVQGAPGTGKTAVGLHRAAYLLYTFRDRLRRSGVLVVGPNRAFLSYIGDVLPALGEVDVTQVTVDDLPGRVTVRSVDSAATATVKGDARLAEVIRRAVFLGVRRPSADVVVPIGARRWRVSAHDLTRMVDDLRRSGVRYGVGRERLRVLVGEALRRAMEEEGDAPTDAAAARLSASAPVREFVESVWPLVDPTALVARLLSDSEFLARAARGLLHEDEQALIRWDAPPRSVRSAGWSVADAFLIDEVADHVERTRSFGHVVVDEAQDLSAMQLRAIGRRCSTGSATVLGDLAQGTTPWASEGWADSLAHLGKPEAAVSTLTRGYRVPTQILELANRLLPSVAPDLPPAESVRRSPGSLVVTPAMDLDAAVVEAVQSVLAEEGSVGVICADASVSGIRAALTAAGIALAEPGEDDAGHRVSLLPASLAKGLEYDSVVVVEPAAIVAAEPRGLRRLFVVLTRAVSRLTVVHARPLPEALAARG